MCEAVETPEFVALRPNPAECAARRTHDVAVPWEIPACAGGATRPRLNAA